MYLERDTHSDLLAVQIALSTVQITQLLNYYLRETSMRDWEYVWCWVWGLCSGAVVVKQWWRGDCDRPVGCLHGGGRGGERSS